MDRLYICHVSSSETGATRKAKEVARLTEKPVYVDMSEHLPNTPWVVWQERATHMTKYVSEWDFINTHKEQSFK